MMLTWILLMGKTPSMLRLGSATRICKMPPTKPNLMTCLLLPVSEVGEKDDSLMGNNRKLVHTISRYRKPGLTYQHQTHIRKQKTLFFLKEWQECHYGAILANKTLILKTVSNSHSISLIGRCMLEIQPISMHPALLEIQ